MKVQRRKKRGSISPTRSPQRPKLRELRSRAILEQIACNESANLPAIDLGAEAESYMMDVSGVASWIQQDMDSTLLFNPLQMDPSILDVDPDGIDLSNRIYCTGLTPEPLSSWNNSLTGYDFPRDPYNDEYPEMTSPSSQTDSLDPTDASLSHGILNPPT